MKQTTPYYIAFFLFFLCLTVHARDNAPKREVRAVWITTLSGLDWPKTKANTQAGREQQKQELCILLDQLKAIHINTILLQARVRGTTIYPSAIEPWDVSLTGSFDKNPGYDPLEFAIQECHKRGMELHAWLVTMPCFKVEQARATGHRSVLKTHPNLCKRHNEMWYLDPGNPGTATYLSSLCREIVSRYDVDGIHFDYIRYPENAESFPDKDTYRKYGKGKNKSDWRRNNVTHCVQEMYHTIKNIKPWVRVSSSPVGKFADLSRYPSRGWNAYEAVYQDAQGWLQQGIHDMLFPMMYFQGDHFYPFAADWNENCYGRMVVPGLGIYFLSPKEKNWDFGVIERELNFIRFINMPGQAYFRSKFLTDNTKGLYDYLKHYYYPYPALTPAISWLDSIPPTTPSFITIAYENGRSKLLWPPSKDNICGDDVRYNIYISTQKPVDTESARNLLVSNLKDCHFYVNEMIRKLYGVHFAVTAIDRFGNESFPVFLNTADRTVLGAGQLTHDDKTLTLPQSNAEFVVLTDATGRIIRTEKYSRMLNIAFLPKGFYQVRTLEKKGISRRLGLFLK